MMQTVLKVENGSCLCTFYNNGKADVMMIDNVHIDPGHRRKGIGAQLLHRAIELAKQHKVDSIELTVNKDNIPAKTLYEKVGFQKTNKDYYRILL